MSRGKSNIWLNCTGEYGNQTYTACVVIWQYEIVRLQQEHFHGVWIYGKYHVCLKYFASVICILFLILWSTYMSVLGELNYFFVVPHGNTSAVCDTTLTHKRISRDSQYLLRIFIVNASWTYNAFRGLCTRLTLYCVFYCIQVIANLTQISHIPSAIATLSIQQAWRI